MAAVGSTAEAGCCAERPEVYVESHLSYSITGPQKVSV